MTPPRDLGRGSGLQLSPTKDLKSVNWGSEVICTAYLPHRMGLTRSGLLKVYSRLPPSSTCCKHDILGVLAAPIYDFDLHCR